MKVNVECTPEEARVFLGLPDLAPLQLAMMDHMQKTAVALEPETVLKTVFPPNTEGFGELQKTLKSKFMNNMASVGKTKK
jgi:Family of unknown function (DUF6489)